MGELLTVFLGSYGHDTAVFFLESFLSAESFQETIHHCHGGFVGILSGVFLHGI